MIVYKKQLSKIKLNPNLEAHMLQPRPNEAIYKKMQ
jgi:hypothetical protein